MKRFYFLILIVLIASVVTCKKQSEKSDRVCIEFKEHSNDGWFSLSDESLDSTNKKLQRSGLEFHGAVSHRDSIKIFETTFNRTMSNCEVFGDFIGIQIFIKKGGGPRLDYGINRNPTVIGDGTATIYSINTFSWHYDHRDTVRNIDRWRVSCNGDDFAEFDVINYYRDAYIGKGMCESGTFKTTTFEPAFDFNKSGTNNINFFWNPVGVKIYLSENKVVISER